MASKTLFALSVLALTRTVYPLGFPGPQPTTTEQAQSAKDLQGWSPKPTDSPGPGRWGIELVKRVTTPVGPRTCGWVYDTAVASSSVLTCGLGSCMLYTSGTVGMAGCCDGSGYSSCGWVNQCYDYSDYLAGKCGADCMANDFVRLCTDTFSPFCQSWTYPGKGVKDYGCGTAAFSTFTPVYSSINSIDYTASVDLPYAPQAALAVTTMFSGGSLTARPGAATSVGFNGGDSDNITGHTGLLLAPIIAIVVVVLLCWGFALGLIIYCCRRSKKLTAKWDQSGNFNNSREINAAAAAGVVAGVASSTPQFGQQQPQPPMNGAAGDYFNAAPAQGYFGDNTKGIPQNAQAYPMNQGSPMSNPASPAPPYAQQVYQNTPPGTYPGVSPIQGQPQMAPYPGQQNFNYPQQQAPQGFGSPQQHPPQPQPQQQSVFELN